MCGDRDERRGKFLVNKEAVDSERQKISSKV